MPPLRVPRRITPDQAVISLETPVPREGHGWVSSDGERQEGFDAKTHVLEPRGQARSRLAFHPLTVLGPHLSAPS